MKKKKKIQFLWLHGPTAICKNTLLGQKQSIRARSKVCRSSLSKCCLSPSPTHRVQAQECGFFCCAHGLETILQENKLFLKFFAGLDVEEQLLREGCSTTVRMGKGHARCACSKFNTQSTVFSELPTAAFRTTILDCCGQQ